jgi:hypothetical protein
VLLLELLLDPEGWHGCARLIRLIETHSDQIARNLVTKIHNSPRTSDLQKIPESETAAAIEELLQHLSEWLLTKTDTDIANRYCEIAVRVKASVLQIPAGL